MTALLVAVGAALGALCRQLVVDRLRGAGATTAGAVLVVNATGSLVLGLADLCREYQPNEVAIEKVFMARNPDSALKLGQARGAAISAVVLRDLPVHEYAASEIKLAVVGRGGAEKQQVQHMVGLMLNLKTKLQADAADALAVAITHAHVRATANRLGLSARQAWGRK